MKTTPIFRINGQYFGYISAGNFFDLTHKFIGITTENKFIGSIVGSGEYKEVWNQYGQYLGEICEANYILRRASISKGTREPIVTIPKSLVQPPIHPPRAGRSIPSDLFDALEII